MPKTKTTTTLDPSSDSTAIAAADRLSAISKLIAKAKRIGGKLEWTDDPSGLRLDLIPNPKRYLAIGISPIVAKIDFGEPGAGIEH